jgi:hypothetical protein
MLMRWAKSEYITCWSSFQSLLSVASTTQSKCYGCCYFFRALCVVAEVNFLRAQLVRHTKKNWQCTRPLERRVRVSGDILVSNIVHEACFIITSSPSVSYPLTHSFVKCLHRWVLAISPHCTPLCALLTSFIATSAQQEMSVKEGKVWERKIQGLFCNKA